MSARPNQRATLCVIGLFVVFYLLYCKIGRHSFDSKLREDLGALQKTFNYMKPSWSYNNTWRQIGSKANHLIYSAYFDDRLDVLETIINHKTRVPIGSLRIFAILPRPFNDAVTCTIRFENFIDEKVPLGRVQPMNEDHGFKYAPYSIRCPLYVNRNNSNMSLPQSVAISYASNRLSQLSPTFVPISYPRDIEQLFAISRPVLSVCVGPLQQNYTDALRIAEFVEMYRILGARHFYFYHLSSSEDVLRLLEHYQREGIADVLQWNVPTELLNDVHYAAIMAQINDCVYRAMTVDNYRYAAIVDLDEVLIPLKHNSLAQYMHQCDEGRTSAYVFRNVFFYKLDSNDSFSMPAHTRNRFSYTQMKVRRTLEIMPAHQRSKCIVNTHSIIEMGNHFVWRAVPGYTEMTVPQSVGLLFHYRDKCVNCKAQLMVDYTARRFGSLIWDRVDETCGQVFTKSGICTM
ncbi:beta-1,4-galactosyltransferase galt-1 isoform X2 [Ceratitis capitata]|uniref:beta-1,4-galactosyltransferase galt-1 isoform X2 n=1 Tax=Ceratitis capitata TaxID=7213 RepID=UPI0006188E8A|nr:beta-1,4-galactosyltransferase galt-1 isoform X2 [Ceratitis capitata]